MSLALSLAFSLRQVGCLSLFLFVKEDVSHFFSLSSKMSLALALLQVGCLSLFLFFKWDVSRFFSFSASFSFSKKLSMKLVDLPLEQVAIWKGQAVEQCITKFKWPRRASPLVLCA